MDETKLPVTKTTSETGFATEAWRPFEALRKEVDRLFADFGTEDVWRRPFRSLARLSDSQKLLASPVVDVTESDKAFELTAELPGLDEKNIEVHVVNGGLTIKGEKKEERQEEQKGYHLSERHYGSFQRHFGLPEGVDADKIEASFKNGVLKVTLPKTAEAQKPAKKIEVRAA